MSLVTQQIKHANCLSDLEVILQHIPLSAVKSFAHNEYQKMNKDQQTVIQSKMLNPNKILPDDLIQNILSFEYCSQTRAVCKLWQCITHKIENCQRKLRKEIIRTRTKGFDDEINRMMPAVNRTFVVDHSRTTLTEEELENGYLGPYSNPQDLLNDGELEDGDRILIHSGTYVMDPIQIASSIRIIGVGSEVILKHSNRVIMSEGAFIVIILFFVYFENIQIHCRGGNSDDVPCLWCNAGNLSMKDCFINSEHGVIADDAGSFQALKCKFASPFQLQDRPQNKIVIIGCEFARDPQDEREFMGDWVRWDCDRQMDPKSCTRPQFECIANVFELDVREEYLMHPFSIEHGSEDGHKGDECEAPILKLAHNTVKSLYQERHIVDGNTMYHHWFLENNDHGTRTMFASQSVMKESKLQRSVYYKNGVIFPTGHTLTQCQSVALPDDSWRP